MLIINETLLRDQAKKRNGFVEIISFRLFKLIVPYKKFEFVLYTQVGEVVTTYIETNFNLSKDYRLTIYNESYTSQMGKLLGLKEVQIGDDDFDNTFYIRTNSKIFTIDLLTNKIKGKLLSLKVVWPTFSLQQKQLLFDDLWNPNVILTV